MLLLPLSLLLSSLPLPSLAFISSDIFATESPELYGSFCASSGAELLELGLNTTTHEELIYSGIRESVNKYFMDLRGGVAIKGYTLEDSLSKMYQVFYGKCANPLKFIKAVKDIMDSSTRMDSTPGVLDNPTLSFDAEQFQETQNQLASLYSQIISSIAFMGDFATARILLGQSLRIIQRFYSRSSWVELGHTDILSILGEPGEVINSVAGPDLSTCSGSTLLTKALTSGYISYNMIDNKTVTMPTTATKCHFGGTTDKSFPGINKDTGSSCFSPHWTNHTAAANLAGQATTFYLEYIRTIIGNGNYTQLLDLAMGSPLVVVIDTTGSMRASISAVKTQVSNIVTAAAAGAVKPSTYVLVPYNDPKVGPATRTEDTELFLAAVNKLRASGGGDVPEMCWGGIQLALQTAPSFSDVYIFTDAPAKDGQLMNSVYALAKEKFSRINFITDLVSTVPSRRRKRDVITDVDEYRTIVTNTGGLMIPSSNAEVANIAKLLTTSIQASKATISIYSQLSDITITKAFPVDNFYTDPDSRVEVKVAGGVSAAVLTSPSGMVLDLLAASPAGLDIEIIVNEAGLVFFAFRPDVAGMWSLKATATGGNEVTIIVEATCTFSFLYDFRNLAASLPHPTFRFLAGQPISNSNPTLSTMMVGMEPTDLTSIDTVVLVSKTGSELVTYNRKTKDVTDWFLLDTSGGPGLPDEAFYIRLVGRDSDNNIFWRTSTSPVITASTSLEITASSSSLVGTAGDTLNATFICTNLGTATAVVNLTVTDTDLWLVSYTPTEMTLKSGESGIIRATFKIPDSALIGEVSVVTVTAISLLDGSHNYASVPIRAITRYVDPNPPQVNLTSTPPIGVCDGATGPDICNYFTWSFEGVVADDGSGLMLIRWDGGEGSSITTEPFSAGTTSNVTFKAVSTCCFLGGKVVAIDVKGNADIVKVSVDVDPDAPVKTIPPTTTTTTPTTTTEDKLKYNTFGCCYYKVVAGVSYKLFTASFAEWDLYFCNDMCLYTRVDNPSHYVCFGIGQWPVTQCQVPRRVISVIPVRLGLIDFSV